MSLGVSTVRGNVMYAYHLKDSITLLLIDYYYYNYYCIWAKREHIQIMLISSLYIYRNIYKKLDAIIFQGLLEESLSFMLLQSSLKSQRPGYCQAKVPHPTKDLYMKLDAIAFQGLLEGSLVFMLLLKGNIVRKTVIIVISKTPHS